MLGPYLRNTELLFPVRMGCKRNYVFEVRQQYHHMLLGTYCVSSKTPYFCRVQRSPHCSKKNRVFILPIAQSHYTSIELTPRTPCCFVMTPFWVVILRDSNSYGYGGRTDPNTYTTIFIEAQDEIYLQTTNYEETESLFSELPYLSGSKMAQFYSQSVDSRYRPLRVRILPFQHSIEEQALTPSANLFELLRSIDGGEGEDEEDTGEHSMYGRLLRLQRRMHDVSALPTVNFGEIFEDLVKACQVLQNSPDQCNLSNLIFLLYATRRRSERWVPPSEEFNPTHIIGNLLIRFYRLPLDQFPGEGNRLFVEAVDQAFRESDFRDPTEFIRSLCERVWPENSPTTVSTKELVRHLKSCLTEHEGSNEIYSNQVAALISCLWSLPRFEMGVQDLVDPESLALEDLTDEETSEI